MQSIFETYLQAISAKFAHKETSEMGYRFDFELLLKGVFDAINVKRIDHDAKAQQGNKPDFVVLNADVPILYIEAKDIGISLDKIEQSDQMIRYFGYTNLVLTDYLEFRFYRNGLRYDQPIKIANFNLKDRTIAPIPESYEHLAKTLLDFSQSQKEPIKSGEHLAKIMAGKAQRIRENVRHFFDSQGAIEIRQVYKAIKNMLVSDLTPDAFADMYSQTLVYGLFVARYYDDSLKDFTRQKARDLVPASNPFLQHFFDHIAGPNFDKRLGYIVDELCVVFQHANTKELIESYLDDADPVIHFYEDFLKEYDPNLRKKMGAYYTPLPVVRFIVRSVDYLLKKEFGLSAGLADASKTNTGIHKVQILDPATGTGTFISATIRQIYEWLNNRGQRGRWPSYVHNDLLPRLHGFELMMAPYTIAHLKLSLAFKQTGFSKFYRRLGIYLTNSLEESLAQENLFIGFGFAESIAKETKEAQAIKNETPIMVVIGNPPYSGESSNVSYKGNDVYKVEPYGGKLQERNPKWLNDDYVKFIRFAESMVEKTGEGIVAMITAHGYLDNPTFRGMRWHLMQTFNEIYVLDLHGNANKNEKAPDGSEDKNIFDIKQGVAIFFGIKRKKRQSGEAKIFRADCFGTRQSKFKFLDTHSLNSVKWKEIMPATPTYEWITRDAKIQEQYIKGFSVTKLFSISNVGIVTARDGMSIQYTRADIEKVLRDFQMLNAEELRIKYKLGRDVQDWKVDSAKKDVIENFDEENIMPISYRPFDIRWTFYTGHSRGFHCRPREGVMKHLTKDNLALVILRQVKTGDGYQHLFVSRGIVESTFVSNKTSEIDYVLSLYLYSEDGSRAPNLKREIVEKIKAIVGKATPESIFDYIYAVLHSSRYRKRYKEFLKIDFPRVPYPKDAKGFKKLVALGSKLRMLHLLESQKVSQFITIYPISGSDIVEKVVYKDGNVFINKDQYFGNVPEIAWNFYIGSYQPAQKWLKDRKGRTLANADIEHYQKMIVALTETEKMMQEIDKALIF